MRLKIIPAILVISVISVAAVVILPMIFRNLNQNQGEDGVAELPDKPSGVASYPITYPMPLATGTQRYFISSPQYPSFTEAAIDPLDPAIDSRQTVRVKVRDFAPIEKVTGTLYTDNKSQTYEFKLIEGTNTDGVWEGSWVIKDTYNVKYSLTLIAKSRTDSSKVDLTFR